MDSNNVGLILSAIIADHWASPVSWSSIALDVVPVSLRLNQIWNSPGFAERHPYHNTRVADIPLNHLSPLRVIRSTALGVNR